MSPRMERMWSFSTSTSIPQAASQRGQMAKAMAFEAYHSTLMCDLALARLTARSRLVVSALAVAHPRPARGALPREVIVSPTPEDLEYLFQRAPIWREGISHTEVGWHQRLPRNEAVSLHLPQLLS